jgi:hypothetical protein
MTDLKNYSTGSFWSHEVFVSFFRKKRKRKAIQAGPNGFFNNRIKPFN